MLSRGQEFITKEHLATFKFYHLILMVGCKKVTFKFYHLILMVGCKKGNV